MKDGSEAPINHITYIVRPPYYLMPQLRDTSKFEDAEEDLSGTTSHPLVDTIVLSCVEGGRRLLRCSSSGVYEKEVSAPN